MIHSTLNVEPFPAAKISTTLKQLKRVVSGRFCLELIKDDHETDT